MLATNFLKVPATISQNKPFTSRYASIFANTSSMLLCIFYRALWFKICPLPLIFWIRIKQLYRNHSKGIPVRTSSYLIKVAVSLFVSFVAFKASAKTNYSDDNYDFSKTASFTCTFKGNILNSEDSISYDSSPEDDAGKITGKITFNFKELSLLVDIPNYHSHTSFEVYEDGVAEYLLESVAMYYGLTLTKDIGASITATSPSIYILALPKNKLAQVRITLTKDTELAGHCLPE